MAGFLPFSCLAEKIVSFLSRDTYQGRFLSLCAYLLLRNEQRHCLLDYYLIESLHVIPVGQKCSCHLQLKASLAVSHYVGNG